MRKSSKILALVLALFMLISALPMTAFATTTEPSAPTESTTFDLVIDGKDGVYEDDADVTYDVDMGEAPTGTALYDNNAPVGLKLDWDAWETIFEGITDLQDVTFTLYGETSSSAVASGTDLNSVSYKNEEELAIVSDYSKVRVLNVYPIPESEHLLKEWLTKAYKDSGKEYTECFRIDTVLLDKAAIKGDSTAVSYSDITDSDKNVLAKHYNKKNFNEHFKEILFVDEKDPEYDEKNPYRYDVIFFGTSDGNGDLAKHGANRQFHDLSKLAYNAVDDFIKAGKGVLFGHDTICSADHLNGNDTDGVGFENFAQFASYLGIHCLTGEEQDAANKLRANEEATPIIKVTKNDGVLTRYPFNIKGDLTVPPTHTLYQGIKAGDPNAPTVWMALQDVPSDYVLGKDKDGNNIYGDADDTYFIDGKPIDGVYYSFNAYLMSKDNVAMIQTGHSSHVDDVPDADIAQEGRVIANTLFYLKQKNLEHYSNVGNFMDNAPPKITNGKVALIEDSFDPCDPFEEYTEEEIYSQTFDAEVTFSAADLGTAYNYWVEANSSNGVSRNSNEVKALAISNLKGYLVSVDQENASKRDDMINKATNEYGVITVHVPADGAPEKEEVTLNPDNVPALRLPVYKQEEDGSYTIPKYRVHIVPVDNANNPGGEVILTIDLSELYPTPKVSTKIEPVFPEGDPVSNRVVIEEKTDPDTGAKTKTTTVHYYPGNYIDKPDKDSKRQEDTIIDLSAITGVDTGERKIIGDFQIVDKDGNVIKSKDNIEATPALGYPIEEELTVAINDIYSEEDYYEDGEFTATIVWVDAETGEFVASDELKIIIHRPDYRVTFSYKGYDSEGEVTNKVETRYYNYGERITNVPFPGERLYEKVNKIAHDFLKWTEDGNNANFNIPVTKNRDFVAQYKTVVLAQPGTPTTQPTYPSWPPVVDTPEDSPKVELERLGGEDRIDTAIEISKAGWDKAKVVILATANQFPDAMAGVPLAKAVDAPILLTVNGKQLEAEVKAEIARLSPEKVYILGQTDAVNANIENELKALYNVERVGGKDRFGTAVEIANEMEEVYGVKPNAVYFVRSDLFPDSLSVSAVAAIEHNPILYVAPNGKVDAPTTDYSKRIAKKATIIGGIDAVNETGELNIRNLFDDVDRIYGHDRYATSVNVCTAKNDLFTGDATALATGLKFPDALTGGAFAAKKNIPVLLVNGKVSPELATYLYNRPIKTLYVFGEKLAVSDDVAYGALQYCKYLDK